MSQLYQLLRGNHSRHEGGKKARYRPGDEIALTREEAAKLGDRVRPAWPAPEALPATAGDVGSELALRLATANLTEVRAVIDEASSAEEVDAIRAAEARGRAREGVARYCDERDAVLAAETGADDTDAEPAEDVDVDEA